MDTWNWLWMPVSLNELKPVSGGPSRLEITEGDPGGAPTKVPGGKTSRN